jgi:hypothetical protein
MPNPYCYLSAGNSQFIRAVAGALDGTLDTFFVESDWRQDRDLPRRMAPMLADLEGKPQALGGWEVAGAFAIFMASCFGKKIFDEFYDRLLKRPLGPFIDRLCAELPNGKAVEIQDVVYLEDIDLTVVISATATPNTANEAAALFLQAHRVAHAYIEQNGRQAPVHQHTIIDGRINLQPELSATWQPRNTVPR